MNQFEISYDDVVRLKQLRNVGEYVTGMVALQDCYEKSVGAQCEQLVSLDDRQCRGILSLQHH